MYNMDVIANLFNYL